MTYRLNRLYGSPDQTYDAYVYRGYQKKMLRRIIEPLLVAFLLFVLMTVFAAKYYSSRPVVHRPPLRLKTLLTSMSCYCPLPHRGPVCTCDQHHLCGSCDPIESVL